MDADQVKASSYTDIFEKILPIYLAMGMSYDQFWFDSPEIAIAYRRADEIRKRRTNEELWMAGMYTADALAATVGNMFTKGSKYQYPSEPRPITLAEIEEREERERKAKMDRIKAKFIARALNINARKGAET